MARPRLHDRISRVRAGCALARAPVPLPESLPEGVASPSPALWPQPQPTRQGHGDHLNGFSKPNMLMKFSNVPAPAPPLQQQRRTRKVASEPCPSQAPILLTDLAHHDIFLVSKLD